MTVEIKNKHPLGAVWSQEGSDPSKPRRVVTAASIATDLSPWGIPHVFLHRSPRESSNFLGLRLARTIAPESPTEVMESLSSDIPIIAPLPDFEESSAEDSTPKAENTPTRLSQGVKEALENPSGVLRSIASFHVKAADVDFSLYNLKEINFDGLHMSGVNLEGLDLSGASFDGTGLYDANLKGANLSGANLARTSFGRADLRGADLRGANLKGAILVLANLEGADLSGANLDGAYMPIGWAKTDDGEKEAEVPSKPAPEGKTGWTWFA